MSSRTRLGILFCCVGLIAWLVFAHDQVAQCSLNAYWSLKHRCHAIAEHPWSAPPQERARIAVAVVVDSFVSEELRNATIENKRAYCEAKGYTLFAPSTEEVLRLADGYPTPWAKFPLARQIFDAGFDYVFMVDADAVIMRYDIELDTAAAVLGEKSLLITTDFNALNSGVFLLKKGEWTDLFLQYAWDSRLILGEVHIPVPLYYENRAFFYLTDMWPKCGPFLRPDSVLAPRYNGNSAYFRNGIQIVNRCLMNSRPRAYTTMPQAFKAGVSFDDTTYAFIVHAAGMVRSEKESVLKDLLYF